MLRVIGAGLSPWVRRVVVVLEEKGIEYEHEVFSPFGDLSDEFKQKSPLGLIPVLDTDEGPLADSTAICAYLEARFPTPALLPDDPYERGRSVWFSEYADALFKHEGTIFFQKAVRGHVLKQEPDQEAVDQALAAMPPFLAYLDRELEGRSYLVGDDAVSGRYHRGECAPQLPPRRRANRAEDTSEPELVPGPNVPAKELRRPNRG